MTSLRFPRTVSLIPLSCTLATVVSFGWIGNAAASFHQPLTSSNSLQVAQLPERCPNNGGGGPAIAYFTTENFYVYICQGGTGRADWRELDYYGVNRRRPNEWIRLRAVMGGEGYYAINGVTRYDINGSFLTVAQNGKTLLKERVLRCEGANPTACESP